MTAYLFEWTAVQNGGGFTSVTLSPTSLPIKINRVEFASGAQYNLVKYTGGATTGGTTLSTVTPFRTGAPAATTVAKKDVTSISGSLTYFIAASSTVSPWTPPFSLMIAPGSVFAFINSTGAGITNISIYFEEQRLQGGF